MELIRQFPLRRLRTTAEHTAATRLILRLSDHTGDKRISDYLDVLVDLVADYERTSAQLVHGVKLSAADLVRHRLQERGISVNALARLIGAPQSNLSEMLNGRRGWSKSVIRSLCEHPNIRAERFLS